jgi:hypothetical protein
LSSATSFRRFDGTLGGHGDGITNGKALEASCGRLVNWQHHDFLAAFQKGQ